MSDEFITLSRQRAAALLIEIAELRSQVTDLTKDRDYCRDGWEKEAQTSESLRAHLEELEA